MKEKIILKLSDKKKEQVRKNTFMLSALFVALLLIENRGPQFWLYYAVLLIPAIVMIWGMWGIGLRTITLDDGGITISYLHRQIHYSWSKLYIAIEKNSHLLMGRYDNDYDEVLVIAPYKLHKPAFIPMAYYVALFHPRSLVYVYFSPASGHSSRNEDIEYNKEELMVYLKNWGVLVERTDGVCDASSDGQ